MVLDFSEVVALLSAAVDGDVSSAGPLSDGGGVDADTEALHVDSGHDGVDEDGASGHPSVWIRSGLRMSPRVIHVL